MLIRDASKKDIRVLIQDIIKVELNKAQMMEQKIKQESMLLTDRTEFIEAAEYRRRMEEALKLVMKLK